MTIAILVVGMPAPARRILVLVDPVSEHTRRIIRGILRQGQALDWSIYVRTRIRRQIPDLAGWTVDGIVCDLGQREAVQLQRQLAVPLVGIAAAGFGTGGYCIVTDNRQIGAWGARHLLERGVRSFAYCGLGSSHRRLWSEERHAGFAAALAQAGHGCVARCCPLDSSTPLAAALVDLGGWLAALPRPAGVMAANDQIAHHVLAACRHAELRVPEDLALLGVDNDPMLCEGHPSLSSIEQGSEAIGGQAVRLLDELMCGRRPDPAPIVMPPRRLVARSSTDLFASEDPVLLRAVAFIRQRASEGICAKQVIRRSGLSRGTLEARFRATLGRTVHAEIRRVRLELVRDLLVRTDLPFKDIAVRTGFCDPQYFANAFRRETGQTPSAFRLANRSPW